MLQYPWEPHFTTYNDRIISNALHRGIDNLDNIDELVEAYCKSYVDLVLEAQINDIMHISIQNALKNTTNQETLSLSRDRIPSSVQNDDTLRFLIALLYEKQLGFPEYIQYVRNKVGLDPRRGKYKLLSSGSVSPFMKKWVDRATKIVEIMKTGRSKVGALVEDSDFIRDWALIDLGEKTGLEVTSNGNQFNIGVVQNNVIQYFSLLAGQSVMMERLKGLKVVALRNRVTNPDDMTIVAKNGPSEVRIKTDASTWGAPFVLAKDASRIVTKAEMAHDIESTPILVPKIVRQIPDVTDLNIGVTESVSLEDLFDGIRFNIAISSEDTGKASVGLSSNQHSMRVVGVAVGTTNITVTATNEAGSATVNFNVTVSAASE